MTRLIQECKTYSTALEGHRRTSKDSKDTNTMSVSNTKVNDSVAISSGMSGEEQKEEGIAEAESNHPQESLRDTIRFLRYLLKCTDKNYHSLGEIDPHIHHGKGANYRGSIPRRLAKSGIIEASEKLARTARDQGHSGHTNAWKIVDRAIAETYLAKLEEQYQTEFGSTSGEDFNIPEPNDAPGAPRRAKEDSVASIPRARGEVCNNNNSVVVPPVPPSFGGGKRNDDEIARVVAWMKRFIEPGQWTELRCLKVTTAGPCLPNYSGFYDFEHLGKMVSEALSNSGKCFGVYFVLNPVCKKFIKSMRDRKDRPRKPFVTATSGKNDATSDEDIIERRWLFVDIDPVRHTDETEVSATDEEKRHAFNKMIEVARYLGRVGWGAPNTVVDSGNGYHVYYQLNPGIPASHEKTHNRDILKDTLEVLDSLFSDGTAKIDKAVFNPSRIVRLPGTRACKGDDTKERPYRLSWVIEDLSFLGIGSNQSRSITIEDLAKLISLPEVQEKLQQNNPRGRSGSNGHGSSTVPRDATHRATDILELRRQRYGKSAVDREIATLNNAAKGERNHTLNRVAFSLFTLVAGKVLEYGHVENLLIEGAEKIGLGGDETQKTIASAWESAKKEPRGVPETFKMNDEDFAIAAAMNADVTNPENVTSDPSTSQTFSQSRHTSNLTPDDPDRLAWMILDQYKHENRPRILKWRDEWYEWAGSVWNAISEDEFRSRVWSRIRGHFDHEHKLAFEAWRLGGAKGSPPKTHSVSKLLVSNVLEALASLPMVHCPSRVEPPSWIGDSESPFEDLRAVLNCKNGLISIPDLARSANEENFLHKSTPSFFTLHSLSYPFDANAEVPHKWIQFLKETFATEDRFDQEAIECLQEWFGYLLTSNTSMQKILLLIGAKRAGKGTITKVLKSLVGKQNCISPTLNRVGSPFGLSNWIGKPLAIFEDARLGHQTDPSLITERFLSISGQDSVDIERKHRETISTVLETRIVIVSNQPPHLMDTSGALSSRFVYIQFNNERPEDKRDPDLSEKFLPEIPGILLWSIAGLNRLLKRGRFIQPTSGLQSLHEIEELTSPVTKFVREECTLGTSFRVGKQELYDAYRKWCETEGRTPSTNAIFFRDLKGGYPRLREQRSRFSDPGPTLDRPWTDPGPNEVDPGPNGNRQRQILGIHLSEVL
jgi:P4 family phage/plasmid primase-like protien